MDWQSIPGERCGPGIFRRTAGHSGITTAIGLRKWNFERVDGWSSEGYTLLCHLHDPVNPNRLDQCWTTLYSVGPTSFVHHRAQFIQSISNTRLQEPHLADVVSTWGGGDVCDVDPHVETTSACLFGSSKTPCRDLNMPRNLGLFQSIHVSIWDHLAWSALTCNLRSTGAFVCLEGDICQNKTCRTFLRELRCYSLLSPSWRTRSYK